MWPLQSGEGRGVHVGRIVFGKLLAKLRVRLPESLPDPCRSCRWRRLCQALAGTSSQPVPLLNLHTTVPIPCVLLQALVPRSKSHDSLNSERRVGHFLIKRLDVPVTKLVASHVTQSHSAQRNDKILLCTKGFRLETIFELSDLSVTAVSACDFKSRCFGFRQIWSWNI